MELARHFRDHPNAKKVINWQLRPWATGRIASCCMPYLTVAPAHFLAIASKVKASFNYSHRQVFQLRRYGTGMHTDKLLRII